MDEQTVPKQADVVVIGGGIVGSSTAYYLAKRGADVVLVEKGELADEQSGRNWGWIRQQGRHPREIPLAMLSARLWGELSQELASDTEWLQAGCLCLGYTEEDMARYEMWTMKARELGLETEVLSAKDVKGRIPTLEGSFLGGAYTPADAQAEPRKATMAVARGAQENGAKIYAYCAANRIEVTGGVVSGVLTEQGVIKAPVVVCAAGAWSRKLGRMVGLNLPQGVVRATAACTAPAPQIAHTIVWGSGVTVRQRQDGRMYIAGGRRADYDMTLDSLRQFWFFLPNYRRNRRSLKLHIGMELLKDILRALPWSSSRKHPFAHTVGVEPKPNMSIVRTTQKNLKDLVPSLGDIAIERAWAGRIDTTPDAVPVLGEADGLKGFIFATGFSGHGFIMGPGAGLITSELILDGKASVDIHPFRLSRFKEKDMADWTETI